MNTEYVVCKIRQIGREIILVDSNQLGYQHSADLYIELELEDMMSSPFEGMLLKAMCAVPDTKNVYDCTIRKKENKSYIQLPSVIFEKEGHVYLSLGGIREDKVIITTNRLNLYVDGSNPVIAEVTPNEDYWELQVLHAMEFWFHEKVEPLLQTLNLKAETLQKLAETQQIQVSELIENIQQKLQNGDFNGSTILHGMGVPNDAMGKEHDLFLDVSNLGETAWHLFIKGESVWEDKGSIKGIDGDNKILVGDDFATAKPKVLFIKNTQQSELIADARGIETNAYDPRLPISQIRISDEINSQGLDEYFTKKVMKSSFGDYNNFGSIILEGLDLNNLKQSLIHGYIASAVNRPIAENGYLSIQAIDNDYCIQTYRSALSECVFQRLLRGGAWTEWKLIAGEVLLWSGDLSNPGDFDIAASIDMFGTLVIENGSKYTMTAPVMTNNNYIMATGAFVQSNNALYSLSAYLIKKSNKVLNLGYPSIIAVIKNGTANYVYPVAISKIVGRP